MHNKQIIFGRTKCHSEVIKYLNFNQITIMFDEFATIQLDDPLHNTFVSLSLQVCMVELNSPLLTLLFVIQSETLVIYWLNMHGCCCCCCCCDEGCFRMVRKHFRLNLSQMKLL